MQDPIQNCICNDRIIKYIIPRIKIYICCQNDASFFISQIYQLEEQFCIIFFNWQITQFINDQQLIFKKVSQSGFQTVFQFGFLKLLYQIMTLYNSGYRAGYGHQTVCRCTCRKNVPEGEVGGDESKGCRRRYR